MSLENISCQKSFGGWHKRYRHRSQVLGCDMVFAVYLPPQAEQGEKLPVLYWLSGLTCTDENFMQKAGAQRLAAELRGEGAAGRHPARHLHHSPHGVGTHQRCLRADARRAKHPHRPSFLTLRADRCRHVITGRVPAIH